MGRLVRFGTTYASGCVMRAGSTLKSSIAKILRQTHGWLELGCPREAYDELENLPDTLHTSREILKLKCEILSAAQDWRELKLISATSAMYFPREPVFAEGWAWAEHKEGRTADAYSILVQASDRYQKTWRTAYFLACFAYALNRVREATEWLSIAFLLHTKPAQLQKLALVEHDFRS